MRSNRRLRAREWSSSCRRSGLVLLAPRVPDWGRGCHGRRDRDRRSCIPRPGRSARGSGLRPSPQDLERLDRQAPGADRSLRGRLGRDRRGEVRAGERPAGCGAERRALVPGPVDRRRRAADRPLADEGRAGRSREAHGARAGGRPARRARPGDAGVRPRGAVRASSRTPASPGSRSAAGSAGSSASTDCRSTSSSRWISSPPTASSSRRARTRTLISSGACAAAAATSGSSPSSSSSCVPLGTAGAGGAGVLADGAIRRGAALLP